jgi:transposase
LIGSAHGVGPDPSRASPKAPLRARKLPGQTLNAVERAVPAGKIIHAIVDNYATHKHPNVLAWLADHPRWVFHFTPTSGSWLNAVEGFFSIITRQRIRRGVFESVADLQDALRCYIKEHNKSAKPFVWTKPAETILAKPRRLPASIEWVSALAEQECPCNRPANPNSWSVDQAGRRGAHTGSRD